MIFGAVLFVLSRPAALEIGRVIDEKQATAGHQALLVGPSAGVPDLPFDGLIAIWE